MGSLGGKTALVTGSTSGIGLAIAKKLAEGGANILLNGFGNAEQINGICRDIESFGVRCLYHPADLLREEDIRALFGRGEREFGKIDILVNNAGMQHVAPVDEFPPEKWNDIIALNLTAAFHTIRLAVPAMKRAGWGRIINIASAHALVASPYKSAYVAAKHGLAGLTKTVALELAEHGVTANAVCPGYVKTPLVENQVTDTARARGLSEEEVIKKIFLASQWTKEFVKAEEVAALTLFLCSDDARNITGACLPVDGGWTAA